MVKNSDSNEKNKISRRSLIGKGLLASVGMATGLHFTNPVKNEETKDVKSKKGKKSSTKNKNEEGTYIDYFD